MNKLLEMGQDDVLVTLWRNGKCESKEASTKQREFRKLQCCMRACQGDIRFVLCTYGSNVCHTITGLFSLHRLYPYIYGQYRNAVHAAMIKSSFPVAKRRPHASIDCTSGCIYTACWWLA